MNDSGGRLLDFDHAECRIMNEVGSRADIHTHGRLPTALLVVTRGHSSAVSVIAIALLNTE